MSPEPDSATSAPAGFATRAIRAATRAPELDQRPTSVPIYQSVTFSSGDADELGDVLTDRHDGYAYSRIGNPTMSALADAVVTSMFGDEQGLVTLVGDLLAARRTG